MIWKVWLIGAVIQMLNVRFRQWEKMKELLPPFKAWQGWPVVGGLALAVVLIGAAWPILVAKSVWKFLQGIVSGIELGSDVVQYTKQVEGVRKHRCPSCGSQNILTGYCERMETLEDGREQLSMLMRFHCNDCGAARWADRAIE